MILVKRDVTDPAEKPLLMAKAFVSNSDGSTSLQMPDGTIDPTTGNKLTPCYAYQEPNKPGIFGFSSTAIGAYQACKVNGQLVAWWTRPQDPAYAYSWVELPN